MLILKGKISSGLKKASSFMEKEVYAKQYNSKLGFIPIPGTLNIKLNKNISLDLENQYNNNLKQLKGNEKFGDVYFLEAEIYNNKKNIKGAILFPVKSCYNKDTLEFISNLNLRKTMELKDSDEITLKIK